ncbi:hypothetical protein [Cytophaga hutchinsonii]|uniref:hypothetical protein n=1 Tax=Cytophaga hutchinsonii TaxID=985 RepID=UPI00003C8715|nr:hypothetical protein [Cytophaga hutchinsonii]SFW99272.1 hypothetical protein SAMN04487930_10190 [Cytophaga hutchinsonii ATCC 33406]
MGTCIEYGSLTIPKLTIRENPTPSLTLHMNAMQITSSSMVDSSSYFILSDAGKNYTVIGNNAILINFDKGYYASRFNIGVNNPIIISISNNIFKGSEPLSGEPLRALHMALKLSGKKTPTLKNRR